MFDPQVVDYIKKALAAGQTKEEINSALTGNGWSEAEIAENFAEASPQPVSQPQPSTGPIVQPVQPEPEIKQTPIQEPQPMAGASVPDFGTTTAPAARISARGTIISASTRANFPPPGST
jgi:hypothetical protein